MQHILYKEGLDVKLITLFKTTFTKSEGEQEGTTIAELIKRFLGSRPKEDIRIFLTIEEDKLLAAVVFSRLRSEKSTINTWLLSPAAVATEHQGKGLGQSLINYAHHYLKEEGVQQVVTYGDIRFYAKVGYQAITEELIPAPLKLSYPEGWIGQSLEGKDIIPIKGKTYCVEALNLAELW